MSNLINALSNFVPPASGAQVGTTNLAPAADQGAEFKAILQQKLAEGGSSVRFSKHAVERLQDRQIDLSSDDLNRIAEATDMVQAKGAREALMMMGNVNLIVSVANRTVVTAMQPAEKAVYTNIDTAIHLGGLVNNET
ncbi:MAG: hypothetical protein JXA52_07510 [Planctomycetes bacterium]|nr:hypothetical protein [Planctomycetota bacterium]